MKRIWYVFGLLFTLSAFATSNQVTAPAADHGTEIAATTKTCLKTTKVDDEQKPEEKYPVLQWKGYMK